MDAESARKLIELNNQFYQRVATSFSQTRNHIWPGWERVLPAIKGVAREGQPLSIADLACGNLRFETFVLEHAQADILACDSCPELLPESASVTFREVDLLAGTPLPQQLGCDAQAFDAVVSFGFMHHIPGAANRLAFVREALGLVRPGGILALSFWRFMSEPRIASKAEAATAQFTQANPGLLLEEGDYLLGWQQDEHALRYCHNFDDEQLDQIVADLSPDAWLIDRFQADGRTSNLNEYLIFQK